MLRIISLAYSVREYNLSISKRNKFLLILLLKQSATPKIWLKFHLVNLLS
ncbi:hypothetical protein ACI8B_320095 [Acinetobacter proteolyticus]|uniref:Uncharacterized protein n=1 Tax=Acinetobacter proteolyticus TaxID=1776741 RepID=A0A653K9N1_9GAMM|nr:hypothetical protein ACI8B_320095 [Acinetobacter proteolyticus]